MMALYCSHLMKTYLTAVNPEGIQIQNSPISPSSSYLLTSSSFVDVIEIQLKDLATSISDTFISVSKSFAQDVFGTTSPAHLSTPPIMEFSATLVVVPDNTTVTLLSFTLNLSTGIITLRFSEAINVSTSTLPSINV